MLTKTCERCGIEYQRYPRSKHQRFCSSHCRHAAKTRGVRACIGCGKQYVVHGLYQRYCSLGCFRYVTAARPKSQTPSARCSICGQERGATCTIACRAEMARRGPRLAYRASARLPVLRHVDATCRDCGATFQRPVRRAGRPRTRCDVCAVRYYSPSSVDWLGIGTRDGWVCAICRKHVDRNLPTIDRMAATVDHIVPQVERHHAALLGYDVDGQDNLQLAHRECNRLKGTGQGQLRLVA